MDFQGSFGAKLLSEKGAKELTKLYRKRAKAIFIASCIDFLLEVARQTPVLTGAARDAILWRAEEAAEELKQVAPDLARKWGYNNVRNLVSMEHTLAKYTPHVYPTAGEGNASRQNWRAYLEAQGQGPGSFSSEAYVPMILQAGTRGSNQYVAKLVFHLGLQGWYLEQYNTGTIPDENYHVPAWELQKDGFKAFQVRFAELSGQKMASLDLAFKTTGV